MSTSKATMPANAVRITLIEGFINDPEHGQNHGKPCKFEVWQAYPTGTLTKWLCVYVEGEKFGWADRPYWCKRASGRNLKHLDTNVAAVRDLIQETRPAPAKNIIREIFAPGWNDFTPEGRR